MTFDLPTVLNLLAKVPAVIAKAPEFVATFNQAISALHPTDQATAKEAMAEMQSENDDRHERLQAKLDAAAKQ